MLFQLIEMFIINILILITIKEFKGYLIVTIAIYALLALINPLYAFMYYLVLSAISISIAIYSIIIDRYDYFEDKIIDIFIFTAMSIIPFLNNFVLYMAYNLFKEVKNDSKRVKKFVR